VACTKRATRGANASAVEVRRRPGSDPIYVLRRRIPLGELVRHGPGLVTVVTSAMRMALERRKAHSNEGGGAACAAVVALPGGAGKVTPSIACPVPKLGSRVQSGGVGEGVDSLGLARRRSAAASFAEVGPVSAATVGSGSGTAWGPPRHAADAHSESFRGVGPIDSCARIRAARKQDRRAEIGAVRPIRPAFGERLQLTHGASALGALDSSGI
jgi:hypothetical protein